MCVDWLTPPSAYGDETIDVITPTDPPFHALGLIRRDELPVVIRITETAQADMRSASRDASPNETGGVLVGAYVDDHPYVSVAIEIPSAVPSPAGFSINTGITREAVERLALGDPRLGYLGE